MSIHVSMYLSIYLYIRVHTKEYNVHIRGRKVKLEKFKESNHPLRCDLCWLISNSSRVCLVVKVVMDVIDNGEQLNG